MNISVKDLFDYKIKAEDGEMGSLFDVLFDDMDWTARYFVVDTGGWLFGRKALVSPVAALPPDTAARLLPVRLTKQQVKDSPDIASDPPLSVEQEIAYNDYYRWPYYWLGGGNLGLGHIDGLAEVPLTAPMDAEPNPTPSPLPPQDRDFRLRSARHVMGNSLRHGDEAPGRLEDFILDAGTSDGPWTLPWGVVALADDDKQVLVPTRIIAKIGWPDQEIFADLPTSLLREAPHFDDTVLHDKRFFDKASEYYAVRSA